MDRTIDTVDKLKSRLLSDFFRTREREESNFGNRISVSDGEDVRGLTLRSVNFVGKDRVQHHTNKFRLAYTEEPTPIFRRGATFSIILNFNRNYKPEEDAIHLTLRFGPSASFSTGTMFKIPLSEEEKIDVEQWSMWISERKVSAVTLKIYIPARALVGLWRYQIALSKKDSSLRNSRATISENIMYVLFNPWCKDDDVYLEDERMRTEYILSEQGKIYRGTSEEVMPQIWTYGQFDYAVLPAVILLLEKSTLKHHERGNAYLMARHLSALINVQDDFGLLWGNWSGNYQGGVDPNQWTGSTEIFERYLSSGETTVKYAQCWGFAGCLQTACRALGIPCRLITCFNSALDSDISLTVDYYIEPNNNPRKKYDESIWNYHCWNEVWLTRPDLSPAYNGWNVIDSTPQNSVDNWFVCGPVSVKAVHDGEVGLEYDVAHLFSEVNSDVCWFIEDPESPWGFTLSDINTDIIGKQIITESLDNDMEDITDSYKYPIGSKELRQTYYKALKQLPTAQKLYERVGQLPDKMSRYVKFTMVKIPSVMFGQPFEVAIKVENESGESQEVEVSLKASAVYYHGPTVADIKQGDMKVSLGPNEMKVIKMPVEAVDYKDKVIQAEPLVKVCVTSRVLNTKETYHNSDVIAIVRTKLVMEAPKTVEIEEEFKVKFSFTNPTDQELTNCMLIIEAPRLLRPTKIPVRNVEAKGNLGVTLTILAKQHGKFTLVGKFNSDQLSNINGNVQILVVDNNN